MDAGELVRLHCDMTLAPRFKSNITTANDFPLQIQRVRCVRAKCELEAVSAHMHQPFSQGLNLAVSHYIRLSVIIRKLLPVLRKNERIGAGLWRCSAALRSTVCVFHVLTVEICP